MKREIKKKIIRYTLILLAAVLILLLRLTEQIGFEQTPDSRFLVARIIDGDTVELSGGDRLRLLAIDSPEYGQPYYDSAIKLLDQQVVGKIAEIKFGQRRRDRYGRLLGFLYIDGQYINRMLVESGLATVYLFKDDDLDRSEVRDLISAQESAIERKTGLWSLLHEPEESYINLFGSLRLHRPVCRSVTHRKPGKFQEFGTREEGLASGLSACRNCRP